MTLCDLIDQRHPFPVPIHVSSLMTGMKFAVWDGRRLYISPAMHSLMREPGNPDWLGRLGRAIEVRWIQLPKPTIGFTAEYDRHAFETIEKWFTPPASAASPQN